VKIIHHDQYNFYNVAMHTFSNQEGGRVIYLEGTYSDSFSGAKEKTPRYNYNPGHVPVASRRSTATRGAAVKRQECLIRPPGVVKTTPTPEKATSSFLRRPRTAQRVFKVPVNYRKGDTCE